MEAGGTDCEEETLQTAFKKLRVDAESLPGAVSVSDVLVPRGVSRACPDPSGAKPKLSCPKDSWHGCSRKTSRGASRTQRRRRSKSPILHPPKFTYCSNTPAAALSPPSGCMKHQRLAVPESVEPCPCLDRGATSAAQQEVAPAEAACHAPPLVFGAPVEYETGVRVGGLVPLCSSPEAAAAPAPCRDAGSSGGAVSAAEKNAEESACETAPARGAAPQRLGPPEAADFQALSRLRPSGSAVDPGAACSCAGPNGSNAQQGAESPCQCRALHQGWDKVEVYSFSGLREVISQCERSPPGQQEAGQAGSPRTLQAAGSGAPPSAASSLSSGSPRSCSEQARAYVDDITIEDLSGYMEYYLYIPKKMSHMAEMMYT